METEELRRILRELHFTAEMQPSALHRLAEVSVLKEYPAETVLFREGTKSTEWFLLCQGRVSLEMTVPGRGKVTILTLGPGDMVGWSALIGQGEMTAAALALEDTRAVVASGPKLLEICEEDHEFGYQLMHQMATALSRRLVATRLQLLDLFSDQPPAVIPAVNEGGGQG